MCKVVLPYLNWSRKHIFLDICLKQAAIMQSKVIGQREMLLGLCISYTNTLLCIMDKNAFFFSFSKSQVELVHAFCLCLSSKQQCKICHRFQCIICVISWCWHFSSVKINERNVLLKAKVITFWVPNSHQQASHMLAVSWALKQCPNHFWSHTVRINAFQIDDILTALFHCQSTKEYHNIYVVF